MTRRSGRTARLATAVLLPALFLPMAVPLIGAFLPLFQAGAVGTLARALADRRFLGSFAYGLGQAAASALVALAVGLPGAFLLARRRFPGRRLLSALSAVPFCVPPLIVAIGFVLYYGREGIVNRAAMALFGLGEPPLRFLYSFAGVVMAHGFYNFPVVMRLVADAWESVPRKQVDAAKSLGASDARVFFTVTLPSIAPAIGASASIVFLLCFYSFVIVLLFGGPGVGTPEVELYRAARFELDRPLASAFALAETAVALAALAAYAWFEAKASLERAESQRSARVGFASAAGAAAAAAYGLFVVFAFVGPLAAVLAESFAVRGAAGTASAVGLGNYASLFARRGFASALVNTTLLGLGSAAIASALGFAMHAALRRHGSGAAAKVAPMLPLAVSSVVMAYGWSRVLGGSTVAAIALVQAVSSFPFALKAIETAVGKSADLHVEAARTLGASRLRAALTVRLPIAAPSIASGFALAFAMSAGDANAAIVAPVTGFDTLATYIYRLAGSYRFDEACAAAAILAALTGFVFFLKEGRDGPP